MVDTAGNQLPYIDKVQLTLAENPEVINLRAIAGEYDYMERFIDLAKLPVFLENAERGNYKVHLDPGFNGADSELKFNFAYKLDPEIQKWFANVDFRRALALGIDREQINQAFYLGLGINGTPIPADVIPQSPGKEWRNKWATLDVKKANAMLDAIGLNKKDAEGFRLRTDNGQRLRIQIDVAQTLTPSWPQQAEMIIQQWQRDRHRRRHAAARAQPVLHARAQRPEPDGAVLQQRLGEPVSLHRAGAAGRSAVELRRRGLCAVVRDQRRARASRRPIRRCSRASTCCAAPSSQNEEQRTETAKEIWKMLVDQVWSIGLVGQSPAYMGTRVVNLKLENVPARTCTSQHCRTPWSGHPEQWYYK